MKSKLLNSTLKSYVSENDEMSSYLVNLSRGRKATPHSWLYENEKSTATLEKWLTILKSANNKSPFADEFNQFDLKQVEKFGPQGAVPSVYSKECKEVLEPIFETSEYNSEFALKEFFPLTQSFAKEAFGAHIMTKRPKSFKSVIDDMRSRDTLTTNSGFPNFTRRDEVKSVEIQYAETGLAYEFPAILLFRQYNGKLRPVWMFPMSLNLIEFTYSQLIQEALATSPANWVREYLTPWVGYQDVKVTLTRQWRGTVVGGDTTKMDAHMRPAQIRLVYEIVKWLFQKPYWDGLYKSLMRINSIPLLYSTEKVYVGTHGLASGSGWTQLTETVLQLFMAWYRKVTGQGIGDDFYWNVNMTAEQLVEYLALFGLPANAAKQSVSDEYLTFLQRMNRKNFFSREFDNVLGAYYPTIRALNSMLNPEKFHKPKDWSSDMFCIRNYMILENCVDDPCFDEFLKFVVRGHKDMIPFANKSASELDTIQKKARLVPGLNPSYNQEKRDKPLSSFVSIQLAKNLK